MPDPITQERRDAFIADLLAVCHRHGLSLCHEDEQGGFLVTYYAERFAEWLADASIREYLDPRSWGWDNLPPLWPKEKHGGA